MKLTITLHYDTRWGEDVRLVFDTVNNVDLASAHPMQTDGKGHWFVAKSCLTRVRSHRV